MSSSTPGSWIQINVTFRFMVVLYRDAGYFLFKVEMKKLLSRHNQPDLGSACFHTESIGLKVELQF